MNSRILIAPLAALSLASGAAPAHAALVGDSTESNAQSFATDQGFEQATGTSGISTSNSTLNAANTSVSDGATVQTIQHGAGAIVGAPGQSASLSGATAQAIRQTGSSNATNTSVTALTDVQVIAVTAGGTIVGSPTQSSAQASANKQSVNPGRTQAHNLAFTALLNTQVVLGTAAAPIVGSPKQSNAQGAATSQSISQNRQGFPSNLLVVPFTQTASNTATTGLSNGQQVGGGTGAIVGSPAQSNGQNGAIGQAVTQAAPTNHLTVGGITQTASNNEALLAGTTSVIL